jgi:hypothetical protein
VLVIALAVLLARTFLSAYAAEAAAPAVALGPIATLKASLIGLVFLALDRSHPGYLMLSVAAFAVIGVGAAVAMTL